MAEVLSAEQVASVRSRSWEAEEEAKRERKDWLTEVCNSHEALRAERDDYQKATHFCDKHKPKGGCRSVCLICSLIKFSAALSRIDYACGEPNEMEMSAYDWHQEPSLVVERVTKLIADRDDLQWQLDRRSWKDLIELLDDHWPESIFPTTQDDPRRDMRPRCVSLIRWVDELQGRVSYLENGADVAQAKIDALKAENRRLKEELASATALEPHETF